MEIVRDIQTISIRVDEEAGQRDWQPITKRRRVVVKLVYRSANPLPTVVCCFPNKRSNGTWCQGQRNGRPVSAGQKRMSMERAIEHREEKFYAAQWRKWTKRVTIDRIPTARENTWEDCRCIRARCTSRSRSGIWKISGISEISVPNPVHLFLRHALLYSIPGEQINTPFPF